MSVYTVLRGLRNPRQHRHRHQGMTACSLHIFDELRRVAVSRIIQRSGVEILKKVIVVGVVGMKLPVISRGGIASPAHQR